MLLHSSLYIRLYKLCLNTHWKRFSECCTLKCIIDNTCFFAWAPLNLQKQLHNLSLCVFFAWKFFVSCWPTAKGKGLKTNYMSEQQKMRRIWSMIIEQRNKLVGCLRSYYFLFLFWQTSSSIGDGWIFKTFLWHFNCVCVFIIIITQ